jgi:hypothetical protein
MRQCKSCHATYERERRQAHRRKSAGLVIQKSASAIARAPNLERLSVLLDLLTKQFGGPHQLYQYWLREIERLKSSRRVGFRLLRFLEMVANLEYLRDVELHERRRQINSPEADNNRARFQL